MTSASAYIGGGLGATTISDLELEHFMRLLSAEPSKASQQSAFDHLLQKIVVTPEQALTLAKCEPTKRSVGLQHSLKRYARSREFAAANAAHAYRSKWNDVTDLLMSLPSVPLA
jgi:hypothetical protein